MIPLSYESVTDDDLDSIIIEIGEDGIYFSGDSDTFANCFFDNVSIEGIKDFSVSFFGEEPKFYRKFKKS